MVGINEFPLPEYTGEGCGGGTRNPPREARLHACSPFHFLLSTFYFLLAQPARRPMSHTKPQRRERQDRTIKLMNSLRKPPRTSESPCG